MNLHVRLILKLFATIISVGQLAACASPSLMITPSPLPTVLVTSPTSAAIATTAVIPTRTTSASRFGVAPTIVKAIPTLALTPAPAELSVKFDAHGVLYETLEDGTTQRIQPLIGDGGETRIAFNGDGAVWFFTDQGVSCVVNGRITHFADERAAIVAAYPWTGTQTLWPVAPDGTICAVENDKLIGYNGQTWLSIPIAGVSTDKIYHIAVGPDGLLAITSDSGLGVYTPKRGWQVPTLPARIPKDLWFNSNLVAGQDGSLWIGLDFMGSGGLLHYVPESQTWTVPDEKNSILSQIGIADLAMASNGNVWITNFTRGILAVRDAKFGTWKYITRKTPFSDIYGFGRVFFGMNGDLWLPTIGHCGENGDPCWLGVAHYANGNWKRYTSADGLVSEHVFAVAVDSKGVPWLVTDAGLQRFKP